MLCRRCADLEKRRLLIRSRAVGPAAGDSPWDEVLCAGCGAVLPAEETTERLLHKLTQLSQFGLGGADSMPLLASAHASKDG
jgi:hypothetical protein